MLVDVRGVVPRGVSGSTIGAGTTLGELEVEPAIPDALREACRLAASPQLRNMSSLGGNLLQATRCWYWRLGYDCRLHGGDRCHAREGEHREHAIFANDFCASAHPSDIAAALVALGARLRTNRRELAVEELYRLPDEGDRRTTTLEDGELILEVELPEVEASVYLKAMDRKRWSFPQVGVAVAKLSGAVGEARHPANWGRRNRAGRRRADPVADRRDRGARRRDAAAAHRVEAPSRTRPTRRALTALGDGRVPSSHVRASDAETCSVGTRPGSTFRSGKRSRSWRDTSWCLIQRHVRSRHRPRRRSVVPLRDGAAEAGGDAAARARALERSCVDEVVVVSGAHALPESASVPPTGSAGQASPSAQASRRCPTTPKPPSSFSRTDPTSTRAQSTASSRTGARTAATSLRPRYGGVRLHPVLLARAVWANVPDEGARSLPARLVPCDDLTPPGDVDISPSRSATPAGS